MTNPSGGLTRPRSHHDLTPARGSRTRLPLARPTHLTSSRAGHSGSQFHRRSGIMYAVLRRSGKMALSSLSTKPSPSPPSWCDTTSAVGQGKRAMSSLSTKPSPWPCRCYTNSSAVGHPTTQISAFTHTLAGEEELKSMFEWWMVEHRKSYNSLEEKEKRFNIFKEELRSIQKENAKPNRTYWVGLNNFSDLTHKEFRKLYCNGMGNHLFIGKDKDTEFEESDFEEDSDEGSDLEA